MNTQKDGGPAFPLQSIGPDFIPGYSGMSLRDWFAGQALAAMSGQTYPIADDGIAMSCYKKADAMLAARKKQLE